MLAEQLFSRVFRLGYLRLRLGCICVCNRRHLLIRNDLTRSGSSCTESALLFAQREYCNALRTRQYESLLFTLHYATVVERLSAIDFILFLEFPLHFINCKAQFIRTCYTLYVIYYSAPIFATFCIRIKLDSAACVYYIDAW